MSQLLWPLFAVQLSLGVLLIISPIVNSRLHQSKDSLRDALDVLARKQRSLDNLLQQPQNYYKSLRTINFDDADDDDDGLVDDDENEEYLDFISTNTVHELEVYNSKDLERCNALRLVIDSLRNLKCRLKTEPPMYDNEQSLFRERERIGNDKRNTEQNTNNENYNHDELAQFFLDVMRNSPHNNEDFDAVDEYSGMPAVPENELSISMEIPLANYEKYKTVLKNKIAKSIPLASNQMTVDHNLPVNGEYKYSIKRFPVAKRSEKAKKLSDIKLPENTDPKVAQDLKSLFGTHTIIEENSSASPTNGHRDEYKTEHSRDQINIENHKRIESMTDIPIAGTTALNTGGQNEIESTIVSSLNNLEDKMKLKKNKIKKSIDWSQYFGIDRRKKKTELLARHGTEERDDDWLLQKYFEIIAENLRKRHSSLLNNENENRTNGGGSEKRDKLEQMDERLKNVMNLIMKDAAKYSMSDNNEADSQDVKDIIMARLAAAYSLEKMRLALNDFKNSIALDRPATTSKNSAKYNNINNNNSSNKAMNQEKRTYTNNNGMKYAKNNYHDISDFESIVECPELTRIKASCEPIQRHAGVSLFVPCVKYKICNLCNDKKQCATELILRASRICETNFYDVPDASNFQRQCSQIALMILQMQPPRIINEAPICYDGKLINSCLHNYQEYHSSMRHRNANDFTNEDLESVPEKRWI